ncbi:hypothetical protein DFH27DRAFT_308488 [Peziza echinospora]|nr:hypothetical protein DFH27DRAFT_308488 [Peziza echinospora]
MNACGGAEGGREGCSSICIRTYLLCYLFFLFFLLTSHDHRNDNMLFFCFCFLFSFYPGIKCIVVFCLFTGNVLPPDAYYKFECLFVYLPRYIRLTRYSHPPPRGNWIRVCMYEVGFVGMV